MFGLKLIERYFWHRHALCDDSFHTSWLGLR